MEWRETSKGGKQALQRNRLMAPNHVPSLSLPFPSLSPCAPLPLGPPLGLGLPSRRLLGLAHAPGKTKGVRSFFHRGEGLWFSMRGKA